MREDEFLHAQLVLPLYIFLFVLVSFFELCYQLWSVYTCCGFPGVVTCGISFPLDQVMDLASSALWFLIQDLFYFIFWFSIDKVRWRSGNVMSLMGHNGARRAPRGLLWVSGSVYYVTRGK